jgi:hypothetical protein
LKLGFEIGRSNPTVASGDNPMSEWIETLVETTDPIAWKSKGMRSVAGGLSEWFDGFDLGPLLADQSSAGYNGRFQMPEKLQGAIDYAGRLVRMAREIDDGNIAVQARRSQILNSLIRLGMQSLEEFSISQSESSFFTKSNLTFALQLLKASESSTSSYKQAYTAQDLDDSIFIDDLMKLGIYYKASHTEIPAGISSSDSWMTSLWIREIPDTLINRKLIDIRSFANSFLLKDGFVQYSGQNLIASLESQGILIAQGAGFSKIAAKGLKWLGTKGKDISAHIFERHMTRQLWSHKSAFSKPNQTKKLIERALKNPDRVTDQGTRVVFEMEFKRTIGSRGERFIRVVVDKITGEIVTSFPQQSFMSLTGVALAVSSGQELNQSLSALRKAHQKASEPGWVQRLIDFFNPLDAGGVAADDYMLEEKRMIEDMYNKVLAEVGGNLSEDQKTLLKDVILSQVQYTNW